MNAYFNRLFAHHQTVFCVRVFKVTNLRYSLSHAPGENRRYWARLSQHRTTTQLPVSLALKIKAIFKSKNLQYHNLHDKCKTQSITQITQLKHPNLLASADFGLLHTANFLLSVFPLLSLFTCGSLSLI